jgi:cytochrome P450
MMGSRTDVVELGMEQMRTELRSLILYERNGSLGMAVPQPILDEIRRTTPVIRWELGVGFFGMPIEDLPLLQGWKDRILKSNAQDRAEAEQIGLVAGAEMDEHLRVRLRERLAAGGRHEDLLDAFIHIEVDGQPLQEDEVVNIMHIFSVAGLDTVTSSLSCSLAWLASNPVTRRRIVADPPLLENAVEELLRYQSPVHSGGARWAARDTEINGVRVKKGEMVYVCGATTNLDSTYFENPAPVNIDRPHVPHVAFAVGTHHCLGSHLARTELFVAIDQLHRRIPEYRVPEGEEIVWEYASVRQAKVLLLEFSAA